MTVLMIPDDGNKFYPSLGPLVCAWMEECLVFGPGDLRGLPLRLDDEQRAFIYRFYEIYPKGHQQEGRRRFKRCALSLAKGLRKTEIAAFVAAAELHPEAPVRFGGWQGDSLPIGVPVKDPFIPLVAYTEEQSDELCYGALKAILEESPINNDFDIGYERIARISGDGKAVSLSSSPSARDGARTTFCVFDEVHWWTSARLLQAHQTMMANLPKRKLADAWALEVTTASEPGAGSVAEATMNYAKAVKGGSVKDARLFYFHRQASDEHDLTTEKGARAAVIEASGPAAAWRDIDGIVELWRDPTTDRSYWERVWCNRLVKSAHKAFDTEVWKRLRRKENPVKKGDLITLGFDGSQFNDSTGMVATHIKTGYQWVVGLWECPFGLADEWQVPADEVEAALEETIEFYEVWRMYADPPYWQSWIAKWAGKFGADKVVEWWTNRRKAMSYALENYDTAIKSGDISHDGDKGLTRHLGNAYRYNLPVKDEDTGKSLWLIKKERHDSPNKIDLAMASVLSWEARTDAIAAGVKSTKSVYEERGIIRL